MEIIAAVLGMFSFDNQVFFNTTNKQMKDGYEWHYVGKQVPDGNPAITIKPQTGGEYILWKLKK